MQDTQHPTTLNKLIHSFQHYQNNTTYKSYLTKSFLIHRTTEVATFFENAMSALFYNHTKVFNFEPFIHIQGVCHSEICTM
jgi:hypothetical protein